MEPNDPLSHLPRDAYYYLVHTLRTNLPPVPGGPQATAWRDSAAIAQVAALCPANAAEAGLAAQHVAANAQAMDCLRAAHDPKLTPDLALRCSAQAASMMRQSQGALRLLLRAQADRRKLEADNEALDRAAWVEHCAARWMTEAPSPQQAEAEPVVEPEPAAPPPVARTTHPSQRPRQNPMKHNIETNASTSSPRVRRKRRVRR